MAFDSSSSKVVVQGRPEIKVAQGYDYFAGKLTSTQDFNYDSAAGGIYSTATEVSKFYQALLNGSLLGARANQIFFDPKNFIASDNEANKPEKTFEYYGLGIRKIADAETEYFHHGGASLGFYSHVIGRRDVATNNVEVATALISYENLTRPLAAALLGDRKIKIKDGKEIFFVDEILTAKMNELTKNHSQDQLLEMRSVLSRIHGTADEKSEKFQKIYAEKYSQQTPSALLNAVEVRSPTNQNHVRSK